jgi:hypothetical protein
MQQQRTVMVTVVVLAAIALIACGEKETPEQKVERLRYNHEIYPVAAKTLYNAEGEPTLLVDLQVANQEIYPVAAKTLYDAEGQPTLLVDLQVANQGTEALEHLTVLVRVLDATGAEKDSKRVTLDMSGVRPGIGARVSATLPGVELLDDEEVTVELETNLPTEVLRGLPEYAEIAGVS